MVHAADYQPDFVFAPEPFVSNQPLQQNLEPLPTTQTFTVRSFVGPIDKLLDGLRDRFPILKFRQTALKVDVHVIDPL